MSNIVKLFSLLLGIVVSGLALAEYGINFPQPVTDIGQDIYNVHMYVMQVTTVLMLAIFVGIAYSLFKFRKSKGYVADQNFHKGWFGTWSWTIIPVMVLGVDLFLAADATPILEKFWNAPKQSCERVDSDPEHCFDMNIKIIGHQWWWEYELPDHGVEYEGKFYPVTVQSRAIELADYAEGIEPAEDSNGEPRNVDNYLRDVDNYMVMPTNKTIRFLNTSVDVLHAWWLPEFGFKRDAIPGYVMETWGRIEKEGIFRGQCAELCGTWHSKMPIVVKAVSPEEFDTWIEKKKLAILAGLTEANSTKEWTKDELMARGEDLYNTNCSACHQKTGLGMVPVFPALKGSDVAIGPVNDHIRRVLDGKGVMPAWKAMGSLDLAAIITYERNAWGNDTGDVVTPQQIDVAKEQ
jgi:cytochrome c oxidase subunit 2